MATETELERLVVRLVGDGSDYKKMLDEAAANTTRAGKKVEDAAGKTGAQGLSNMANQAEKAKLASMRLAQAVGLPPEALQQVSIYSNNINPAILATQAPSNVLGGLKG